MTKVCRHKGQWEFFTHSHNISIDASSSFTFMWIDRNWSSLKGTLNIPCATDFKVWNKLIIQHSSLQSELPILIILSASFSIYNPSPRATHIVQSVHLYTIRSITMSMLTLPASALAQEEISARNYHLLTWLTDWLGMVGWLGWLPQKSYTN